MADEKLPKDYDQSTIQKIVEGIKRSIGISSKKSAQDLFDTSQEIKDSITKLAKKVANLASEGGEQGQNTYVPAPEDLTVFSFGTWGFATVNPFLRWKYRGKIVGYEFYGTMNVDDNDDFEPHIEDYVQKGTHVGYNGSLLGQGLGTVASPNSYLNTTPHILDRRVVKAIASKRLILENVTTGEWGYIGGYFAVPFLTALVNPNSYKLFASRPTDPDDLTSAPIVLEWRNGDTWRIKDYPNQQLFSIGALAIFYKRVGDIYVKVRTVGKGHSYSNFTEAVSSSAQEVADTPVIVMPVHGIEPSTGLRCGRSCTLAEADDYKPRCPVHDIVEWSEIESGTRETDHFSFFGFEACNVEFVYEELDSTLGDFFYQTKRSFEGQDETFRDGDIT